MAEIHLKNLAHSYHPQPQQDNDYALKQIDHVWQDGKAYALLGASGCGKSTLLNIISGLVHPSQGEVLFDGENVTHLATEQRHIAQVFQFPVVYDTMSVYDNLAFPLRNRGHAEDSVRERVLRIADMLELNSDLGKKAQGLTADVKQKISLGRGLVRKNVAAILFDEPLTVIDPHLKWLLRMQLKALHQQVNNTMIYVTHDQTEALTFADQVVVMHQGYVVQMGTPQDLFERPEHTFVGYFIGSPGMNILPARIEQNTAHIADQTLTLPGHYEWPAQRPVTEIGIRPECLSLQRPSDTEATLNTDSLPVTIQRIEDIGRHKIARTQLAGYPVNVIVPEGKAVTHEYTQLCFTREAIHVYADSWRVKRIYP